MDRKNVKVDDFVPIFLCGPIESYLLGVGSCAGVI